MQTNCPIHDPPQWRCTRCDLMIDDPAHIFGCANRSSSKRKRRTMLEVLEMADKLTDLLTRAESLKNAPREQLAAFLYSALVRWNVDQEIGSNEALRAWIDEFIDDELGVCHTCHSSSFHKATMGEPYRDAAGNLVSDELHTRSSEGS